MQRNWGVRAWADERGATARADELQITVREMPWLLSGGLQNATVSEVRKREAPQSTRAIQFLQ